MPETRTHDGTLSGLLSRDPEVLDAVVVFVHYIDISLAVHRKGMGQVEL